MQVVQRDVGGGDPQHFARGVFDHHGQRAFQDLAVLHLVGVGLGDGVAAALLGHVVEIAPARFFVVGLIAFRVILELGEFLDAVRRHHHVHLRFALVVLGDVGLIAAGGVVARPVHAEAVVVAVEGVRLP